MSIILKDPVTGEIIHSFGPKVRKAGWAVLLAMGALVFAVPFVCRWLLG